MGAILDLTRRQRTFASCVSASAQTPICGSNSEESCRSSAAYALTPFGLLFRLVFRLGLASGAVFFVLLCTSGRRYSLPDPSLLSISI